MKRFLDETDALRRFCFDTESERSILNSGADRLHVIVCCDLDFESAWGFKVQERCLEQTILFSPLGHVTHVILDGSLTYGRHPSFVASGASKHNASFGGVAMKRRNSRWAQNAAFLFRSIACLGLISQLRTSDALGEVRQI